MTILVFGTMKEHYTLIYLRWAETSQGGHNNVCELIVWAYMYMRD